MDKLVFEDLAPISIPVEIGERKYVLREASEDAARIFLNARIKCTVLSPDGKPIGVSDLMDIESLLVSLCLFEVYGDGKERPVLLSTVRSWPHRSGIVEKLFQEAMRISGLNNPKDVGKKEKEDESKNGQAGAMATTSA